MCVRGLIFLEMRKKALGQHFTWNNQRFRVINDRTIEVGENSRQTAALEVLSVFE